MDILKNKQERIKRALKNLKMATILYFALLLRKSPQIFATFDPILPPREQVSSCIFLSHVLGDISRVVLEINTRGKRAAILIRCTEMQKIKPCLKMNAKTTWVIKKGV